MNVVLYARVSSDKQAEKDLSIPAQLKHMRQYCLQKGWKVVGEFVDEAESARTANRPQFQRMIAEAKTKRKPFDAILVWKLSRFARNREDSVIYKSLLRRHGVQVLSMNEAVDDSPSGGLLEGMIEVMDEFYSANLAQDTLRGMRENASQGFFTGGTPPLGYRPQEIQNGRATRRVLEIDLQWSPVVQRIFLEARGGLGAKEIAARLNNEGFRTRRNQLWSKNTILYTLRNEIYTGTYIWNKKKSRPGKRKAADIVRVPNAVPALVTRKTFELVQMQLNERAPSSCHPRSVSSPYLLSGLIRCGSCDRVLQGGSAKSGKHHYYACFNRLTKGKAACSSGFLPQRLIEDAVLNRIRDYILTEDHLLRLTDMVNDEIQRANDALENRRSLLATQLIEKRKRLERLFEGVETGHLSFEDVAPRIKKLREEIDELEEKAANDQNPVEELRLSKAEVAAAVSTLRETLDVGTLAQRKQFLRSFIRKIEYNHPKVTIIYTFPLLPSSPDGSQDTEEFCFIGKRQRVLCIDKKGSSGRTRTYNPPVNSRVE